MEPLTAAKVQNMSDGKSRHYYTLFTLSLPFTVTTFPTLSDGENTISRLISAHDKKEKYKTCYSEVIFIVRVKKSSWGLLILK